MATAPITKKLKKAKGPASGATAAGQVQSLSRGLTLLEYISESTGGIALTDIALQSGLPNSTTHRLLMTLEQHGFVRQTGDLGLWVIASNAFIIGSSFLESRNLLALVHPILRRLMDESGETVNLAILDHSEYDAVIVDQVQCNALMRMSAPIGGKLPLHASGAGKAFIANLSEDKLIPLLSKKGLHAYTPHTLTNPSALKENLQQAKKQGFSYDDEEHALGLRCIGACIYDEHKEAFAAISISGPLSRITDDRVTELGAMVIKAAKVISREYGANR